MDSKTQNNNNKIKGMLDNTHIVIVRNSATYEVVEAKFESLLKYQGLYTSLQINHNQTK